MTKEEFVELWTANAKKLGLSDSMIAELVPVECDCGAPCCQGWRMADPDELES